MIVLDVAGAVQDLIHSPVPNFGRYFAFCSSVPKYVMGSVPIPVWPMNVTAQLPSSAEISEARAPVTLPRARPPYSSGTSIARRPISPAFRINSRMAS